MQAASSPPGSGRAMDRDYRRRARQTGPGCELPWEKATFRMVNSGDAPSNISSGLAVTVAISAGCGVSRDACGSGGTLELASGRQAAVAWRELADLFVEAGDAAAAQGAYGRAATLSPCLRGTR